jgi:hypothetical protein
MGSGLREIAENHKEAMENQSRDYTNNGEQELEGGVVEESESFTRRPNQEIDVGMCDAVRQAATSR